ncbi:MAG: hypothetical protein OXU61_03870 [Gammaproteobacteria bacterium]|nr:hypothetical protein [Gammaproteobacteria bacterium]
MTQANVELLRALREAGASEEAAEKAAQSVAPGGQVATKEDLVVLKADLAALKAELGALEARLTWRMVGLAAVGIAVLKLT